MEKSKIIYCNLVTEKDDSNNKKVVLDFGDDYGCINFNDDDQESIKALFNNILQDLIENDVQVELSKVESDIKPGFIKFVAEEYIEQLNSEIENVRTHIKERLEEND